ncbi:hypothetical protein [Ferroacidibacillus organovorans]|uniref:Yip1 domain-containing protein n=1 Tax=Ferroacidibacillus organovorans TaxID=1765683 RepID=A0A117SXG1_9BACL|nr:hypothetical protein [Ferroacidibacillus organovorans]KUO95360.1 hypothetical protein ATW55_10920 [Ferroacidibacillus organovorans]
MSKAIPSKSVPRRILPIAASFTGTSSKAVVLCRSVALAIFAAAVSRQTDLWIAQADHRSLVLPHALVYFALVLSGQILGLTLSGALRQTTATLLRAVLPKTSEKDRAKRARSVAACIIVLGMLPVPLWTLPSLNAFLDGHIWLLIETYLVLFFMGFLTGGAWSVLLLARLWRALLFQAALVFMMLVNVLAANSW